MNNKDIKLYKINLLKKIFGKNDDKDEDYKYLEEINDIIDVNTLKFDDENIDEYFNSIGRNIKNYNIFNDIINKNKEEENIVDKFENLINERKIHIENSIKNYYKFYENKKNIIQLLYFSTEAKYDLESFITISDYVNSKYFIPEIQKEENNNKYISIKYAFPLIEEILSNLIQEIMYDNFNVYNTLISNDKIDVRAKEHLFEKLVTFHLTPKKNEMNTKFFKDIIITDVYSMKKFIPREKERVKKLKKKITLTNGVYLFTQSIINGKDLDLLIIQIINNVADLMIAFKILIHKDNYHLFTFTKLKECFKNLINNFENIFSFDLDENSIYFTYIFDASYKKKKEKEFNIMLEKCNENLIKFILFDPEKNLFINNSGEIVDNLSIYLTDIYEKKNKRKGKVSLDIIEKKITLSNFLKNQPKENDILYNLSNEENKLIIDILKEDCENGDKIKGLHFLKNGRIQSIEEMEKNKIYIKRDLRGIIFIYFSKTNKEFNIEIIETNARSLNSYNLPVFDIYILWF